MAHDIDAGVWWLKSVIPTGQYRWKQLAMLDSSKINCVSGSIKHPPMKLQHLVGPANGGNKRRWIDVPVVPEGASDDA